MRLTVVLVGVVCALAGGTAWAAAAFADPSGDSGAAPDLTSVLVNHDASGQISFRIDHPNQLDLARGTRILVFLDVDRNARTGAPSRRGADYLLNVSGSSRQVFLLRWNGATFDQLPASTFGGFFGSGFVLLSINRSELGGTRAFNFWVFSFEGDDRDVTGDFDNAPDTGTWSYRLQATAPVSLSELVGRVRSGVIRIEVTSCKGRRISSGILIGPRHVATVEHVVGGATKIVLKRSGRLLAKATVIGSDRARDIALLKTSGPISGYRFQLSLRTPTVGESVAALGYPAGLPLSVTRGTVSGLDRSVVVNGIRRRGLVQTDAPVNIGSSGGPLLAVETGEVVGLVDLGPARVKGIAFAVSARTAKPLLARWAAAPKPAPGAKCGSR